MINIKLHKNELQLIKESIESSKWFGNEPKLCDRVLKKLDKALTIPFVSNCNLCNVEINYKGVCEMCYTEQKLNDFD
jgi:hypothetical protein